MTESTHVLCVYDPVTLLQDMVVVGAKNPDDPAWNPPGLIQVRIPVEMYEKQDHDSVSKLLPDEVVKQLFSIRTVYELGLTSPKLDPPIPRSKEELEYEKVLEEATSVSKDPMGLLKLVVFDKFPLEEAMKEIGVKSDVDVEMVKK